MSSYIRQHNGSKLILNTPTWEQVYSCAILQQDPNNVRIVNLNLKTVVLSADTLTDLWNVDQEVRNNITTAETLSIVSDNANDTSAGTGCREVNIIGLDANYDYQEEVVITNGITPVTTVNTFMDFRRADIRLAGNADGSNTGTITISGTTSGTVLGQMDPTEGITTNSHFVVPAGFNAYYYSMQIGVTQPGGTTIKEVEVTLNQRWPRTDGASNLLFRYPQGLLSTRGTTTMNYTTGLQGWSMREKVESWLTVEAATNNTVVTGNMQILLVREKEHEFYY